MDKLSNKEDNWLWLSLTTELKRDGGNPSHLIELLCDAVESKVWQEKGITFREFVTNPYPDGIDTSIDQLKHIIQLKHKFEDKDKTIRDKIATMRQTVNHLLTGELGEKPGPNGNSVVTTDYTGKTQTTDYIRARLKRSHPTLYHEVKVGKLTPHAAGKKAGFIKKRQWFHPGDPVKTAAALRRHFDDDGLRELIILLQS